MPSVSLTFLGRMKSSSIFSGFCLIRVIKQQDLRFITRESGLSAVVQSFHLCPDPSIQLLPYFRDSPIGNNTNQQNPEGFSSHPNCNSESVSFFFYCFSSPATATMAINISYQPSVLFLLNASKTCSLIVEKCKANGKFILKPDRNVGLHRCIYLSYFYIYNF